MTETERTDDQGNGEELPPPPLPTSDSDDVEGGLGLNEKENFIRKLYPSLRCSWLALVLIVLGIILKVVALTGVVRDPGLAGLIYLADWALFIGVIYYLVFDIGYYLFKLFLIVVRQTVAAVKQGLA